MLSFKSKIPYLDLDPTQEEELPDEFGIGRLILQVDHIDPTPTDQALAYVLGWTIDEEDGLRLRTVLTPAQQLAEEDFHRRTMAAVELPATYVDFHDVFDKREFDTLPPRRIWDHAIELIEGAEPRLDCKIYPLGQIEQEKLDEFLSENLRMNRIRPSRSPMASPFFFIKKKDSSL
jgi:hypothetical protein